MVRFLIILTTFSQFFLGCNKIEDPYANYDWQTIEVTATAYNSLRYQTDGDPHITAFGDSLVPGLRYVAVSRDLLKKGLKHNTPVKIEGLDSIYIVKDKMHYRWKNRIDIYMGLNVKKAKAWGKKKVTIAYGIPKE
ncbi:3D domain-containing protein [Aestuariivivens insulae]|uniref:3D domain-containing protein n=1 Tax=Aestuariivivens insulae TaxID=1621988 RepID=UPI001F584339|nr:3D domain-containing protein [Aestuariivivens insulae]